MMPTVTDVMLVDDARLHQHDPTLHALTLQQEGIITDEQVRDLPPHALTWYTSFHLLSTFALMGLKPVHASRAGHACMQQATRLKRKIVSQLPIRTCTSGAAIPSAIQTSRCPAASSSHAETATCADRRPDSSSSPTTAIADASSPAADTSSSADPSSDDVLRVPLSFGLAALPSSSCVVMLQSAFTALVYSALQRCIKNSTVYHQLLYGMCREITDKRRGLVILLAGTSGTGKSTLASLLAERLRITAVVSTDSIRHTLRGRYGRDEYPHLHVSTYETDQMYNGSTVASHPLLGSFSPSSVCASTPTSVAGESHPPRGPSPPLDETSWSQKKKVLHGYKSQSHLILHHLTALLHSYAASHQTVIIEGVHLLPKAIVQYMTTIPGCIPFFIFISNEVRHTTNLCEQMHS
jgi:2-phosphoglycerate kinase